MLFCYQLKLQFSQFLNKVNYKTVIYASMRTTESDVLKTQNHQTNNGNHLFSSTQNIQGYKKQMSKNSEQSISRDAKQPMRSEMEQQQRQKYLSQNRNMIRKKPSINPSISEFPLDNSILTNISTPKNQQQIKERIQQDQRRDYLANKVTPVLNKMLVKIVNHKPKDLLEFMIKFLKSEEDQFEQKRFNDKALNDVIGQDKHLHQVFDSTVVTKFLKFKK